MRKVIVFCLFFLLIFNFNILHAQVLRDKIFNDNIKTIQFFNDGIDVTYPIVYLNSNTLTFQFDELNAEIKNYEFTIIHCNADWTPSILRKMEYIDGFESDEIRDYSNSFNTYEPYVHYKFKIPNSQFRITKTGNYILKIYENSDTSNTVIHKRFVVANNVVSINGNAWRSSIVSKNRTHQQVDFSIKSETINIENPSAKIWVSVMQNFDWNTIIEDVKPRYALNNTMFFDIIDQIQFPALSEWRTLDIRSFRYLAGRVQNLQNDDEQYIIQLEPDEAQGYKNYDYFKDLNGRFISRNIDNRNPENESEYATVKFTLKSMPLEQHQKVFIYGELSNYELKPAFEMEYFSKLQQFEKEVYIKQGYYNYRYVVADTLGNKDFEQFESNNYQTENDYQILVYYRAPGEFYDQIIGFTRINTLNK